MSKLHMEAVKKEAKKSASSSASESGSFTVPQAVHPRSRDFSPLEWSNYFDERRVLSRGNGDTFQAYLKGFANSGPAVVLLHGGGYSGLSWSVFTRELLSLCSCKVIALDLKEHGNSKTVDSENFSLSALMDGVIFTLESLFNDVSMPPIVLVGHSMGGALAAHVASNNLLSSVVGLVVIDVVEGTALEALSSMRNVIRGRPKSFRSINKAIEWSIQTGQANNVEAARVSMPGQIKPRRTAAYDENDENEDEANYEWSVDLLKTEPYWEEWFKGLSNKFLSSKAAKLLILAGTDRLDRDLIIGQMQGKFQLELLPQCGHTIHEDAPDKVAISIAQFLVRNRFSVATDKLKNDKRTIIPTLVNNSFRIIP